MREPNHLEGLTSLAILKVNWDENRSSYLDNFLPFVKEALRRSDTDTVSAPSLQEHLVELTGLEIPQPVVSQLLKRARKKENFVRYSQKTYYRTESVFEGDSLDNSAQGFQRKTTKLVERLRSYAQKEYGVVWSTQKAELVLFDYLKRLAAPVVKATRSGTTHALERNATQQHDYVISAFIKRCIKAEPDLFEYLEALAIGNMVASAVYYENPNTTPQSYDGVDIYLDTPLLLFILGVNGEDMKAAYLEFVDLLKDAGANLCAFKITIDETRRVLNATAAKPLSQRQARIPSKNNPVQSQLSCSDLRLLGQQLESQLRRIRITPVERPDHEAWLSKTIDEKDLQERLGERYSDDKPDMLRHDVQAAISIHYIRKGRKPGVLASAGAIFVTNNSFLAWTCSNFFVDQLGAAAKDVPHCMMYDELATRTWLMSPNPDPTLPRKQLLAHAYAAMLPEDGLVEKYLAELEHLQSSGQISENDYLYFRSAEGIGEILTDVTLNDENAFTEATVQEVIKRREAEIRAQTEKEREEQRERAVEAENKLKQKQEREAQLMEGKRNEERRATTAERRADSTAKTLGQQHQNIEQAAQTVGKYVDWGLRLTLMILLGLSVYVAIPNIPNNPGSELWKFLSSVGVGGFIVWQLTVVFFQSRSWSRKAGDYIESKILDFLLVDEEQAS